MAKHYAEFGPVFIMKGKRSSNPNANTLIAYMYKHHVDPRTGVIILDLDENSQMVEDLGNPIAKINWRGDTIVKVQSRADYDALSIDIKVSIESTFRDYLTKHNAGK